jgi:hypothetical protein
VGCVCDMAAYVDVVERRPAVDIYLPIVYMHMPTPTHNAQALAYGDVVSPRPGVENTLKKRRGFGDGFVAASNPDAEDWKYFENEDEEFGMHLYPSACYLHIHMYIHRHIQRGRGVWCASPAT